ncbi:hypothetical protein SAY87_006313 [Trapa incisa]|uniref:Prolamin-like domain-containing protein n=1 Tax=Trapa incisa TaxID=236973 RepID=A0AAN7JXA5_9MYRT|nr:hypothetical protein SAY87_006313 [Trapa incisa]
MVSMAAIKLGSATALFLALLCSAHATRTLMGPKLDLPARLMLVDDQEPPSCWESLFQLQSCTGEVIMFFVNGETYLGPKCCAAIRAVEQDCWPDLLATLGYTTEETDVLEEYCNGSDLRQKPLPVSPEAKVVNPLKGSSSP